VPIVHAIEGCAGYFKKRREEILLRCSARRERRIAIYLSKVLSGKKHSEVGNHFGIKVAAVSNVLREMETRLETDTDLKKDVRKIRERLLNVI